MTKKKDSKQDYISDHQVGVIKEPVMVFYDNYDLYDTPGPGPGAGFYSKMDKYKSVSDFRKKKRKSKMKKRRAALLHFLFKVAEKDNNNLTDPTEETTTPIPISPAEPNPIGLLDSIYPKSDLEGKPVTNLYYGRLEADDGKESKKKK